MSPTPRTTRTSPPVQHAPLNHPPRRIRPPFDAEHYLSDDRQRGDESLDQWKARGRADRVAALLEPLDGVELGAYDRRIVDWLAGWDVKTVGAVASLLYRVRTAGPIGGDR